MKKGLILAITIGSVVFLGTMAEAAGTISKAHIKPGQTVDNGPSVSCSGYKKIGVYGRSNSGTNASNAKFKIMNGSTGETFRSGTIYVGSDVNEFYNNNLSKVKTQVSHSTGKHAGASIQACGS